MKREWTPTGVNTPDQLLPYFAPREMPEAAVFVSGLPTVTDLDPNSLAQVYSRFGAVRRVHLVRNPLNGECRGFAFVRFEELDPLFAALDYQGPLVLVYNAANFPLKTSYEDPRNDLFIRGIPTSMNEDEAQQYINSKLPPHLACCRFELVRSPQGHSKGFGWAGFDDVEIAQMALQRLREVRELNCEMSDSKKITEAPRHLRGCRTLFVKHVASTVDEERFRKCLHGVVNCIKVEFLEYRKADFRLAYATFANQKDAWIAMELLNLTFLDGLYLHAEWKQPLERTSHRDRDDRRDDERAERSRDRDRDRERDRDRDRERDRERDRDTGRDRDRDRERERDRESSRDDPRRDRSRDSRDENPYLDVARRGTDYAKLYFAGLITPFRQNAAVPLAPGYPPMQASSAYRR
jgi:RNA recognition motif-containing protein